MLQTEVFRLSPGREHRLRLVLESDVPGMAWVQWGLDDFTPADSVAVPLVAGEREHVVPLSSGVGLQRLRLLPNDRPCAFRITRCLLESQPLAPLAWPACPPLPYAEEGAAALRAGKLRMRHGGKRWGGYELWCDDVRLGTGSRQDLLVWRDGAGRTRQQALDVLPCEVALNEGAIVERLTCERAGMTLTRRFAADGERLHVTFTAESDGCALLHVAPLAVLAAHGGSPRYVLLPGVEHLHGEPSGSGRDIDGWRRDRSRVAPHAVTWPALIAIVDGAALVCEWEPRAASPWLESPSRTLPGPHSLLGCVVPPVGPTRFPNAETAHTQLSVRGPLVVEATLRASELPLPALLDALAPRPDVAPPDAEAAAAAFALLARGLVNRALVEDGRYRINTDRATPVRLDPNTLAVLADLAQHGHAERVGATLAAGRARLARDDAEVRAAWGEFLVLDEPIAVPLRLCDTARALTAFAARVRWLARHGGDRLSLGAFARDTAMLLRGAVLTADDDVRAAALAALAEVQARSDELPRGALEFEIAPTAPSLRAATHVLEAMLWGHELNGDTQWLRGAHAAAAHALPFVWLAPIVDPPAGAGPPATFAAVPALASSRPNGYPWLGRAVPWIGAWHARQLYRLAAVDPAGARWLALADGLTDHAVGMLFPPGSPHEGLLGDSFDPRVGRLHEVWIHPGALHDLVWRRHRLAPREARLSLGDGTRVFAPCALRVVNGELEIAGLPAEYQVLVVGREADIAFADPLRVERVPGEAWTIVTLRGAARATLR